MTNEIPMLFIVFNRLDTTKQVFEKIKDIKPTRLYIASDGPRKSKQGENETVDSVRNFILNSIDWVCDTRTLFRENNLGCNKAVSSAIDWFFEEEDFGIILEDDCVPSKSFYPFCKELLEKYKNDKRISGITGTNFNKSFVPKQNVSYHYSEILYMWGWATWKDRWIENKDFIGNYKELMNYPLKDNIISNRKANIMWIEESSNAISGKIDTWDYQWLFSNICNHKLTIVPAKNLIHNIGFSEEATHTKHMREDLVPPLENIDLPLEHPKFMIRNSEYDDYFYTHIYGWATIKERILRRIKKIFS